MNEELGRLTAALSDAGCGPDAIERAKRLWAAGHGKELIRYLRCCRCDLMDQLHESQRRVDRLDYLIRQTEKEIKTITERR